MKLLIVVINYFGSKLTMDCLRSLQAELAALPNARVDVCENGSGADEVTRLRSGIEAFEFASGVALTILHPNRGFTGGNNALIRPALTSHDPPDAFLLLNNDTIVRPGAIQSLVRFMGSHPDVGICGSRLEYPNGESQLAARRFLTMVSEFESYARLGPISRLLARWKIAPPEREEPHECGWVPGAALMVRREVFDQIGLLDEDLYTYFDDVDFCLRARRAGWPTWYVPESRIIHLVGQTTGVTVETATPTRRADYWFWARRHYFLKNFGPLYTAAADLAAIAGLSLWRLRCLAERRLTPDPPHLLWDLVRHSVFMTGFLRRPVVNPALAAQSATGRP